MARKITITISGDITFNATEKEEKLIKIIDELPSEDEDYDEIYDKLVNKLETLLLNRIYREMKDLNDVEIHDTDWE